MIAFDPRNKLHVQLLAKRCGVDLRFRMNEAADVVYGFEWRTKLGESVFSETLALYVPKSAASAAALIADGWGNIAEAAFAWLGAYVVETTELA